MFLSLSFSLSKQKLNKKNVMALASVAQLVAASYTKSSWV